MKLQKSIVLGLGAMLFIVSGSNAQAATHQKRVKDSNVGANLQIMTMGSAVITSKNISTTNGVGASAIQLPNVPVYQISIPSGNYSGGNAILTFGTGTAQCTLTLAVTPGYNNAHLASSGQNCSKGTSLGSLVGAQGNYIIYMNYPGAK